MSQQIMRAVRFHEYGAPGVLTVEDVRRPEPGAGEVLIQVHAAGVNQIDWKLRAGYLQQYMPLELPHILGFDLAGTVQEVGTGVTGFAPGQAVFGRGAGTYAEYAVAPVTSLALKPENLSFDEAATLAIGGITAWSGLFDAADLRRGQRILVQGAAGGVGSYAVQFAKWKGAHVAGTASTENLKYVRALGADEVIDYTAGPVEDTIADLDVVFDTVGGTVTDASWPLLRPGGILVVIAGTPDEEAAGRHGVRTAGVQGPPDASGILRELAGLIESGAVQPQVGKVFSLDEAARAHAQSETNHGRGRIVLHVTD
jgi:NADPH:quinone reductase-like Zn-dependent oxidoreductase